MLQRWFLFPRYLLRPLPSAGTSVRGLETLTIDTPQGNVEAWFLPGDGASPERPAPVVIFAHGNGELIDDWPEMLDPYRRMGLSVFLPEYRGYGRSAGTPSELHIVEDYVRFHDLVRARPDVDAGCIVLHGRSLGGGVVCALAGQRSARGLVLESTFTCIADIARRWLIPRSLIEDRFESESIVRTLDIPILLFHGTRDRVVPYQHALALVQAAKRGKLVTYDCDHNDMARTPQSFWSEIRRYLESLGISTSGH